MKWMCMCVSVCWLSYSMVYYLPLRPSSHFNHSHYIIWSGNKLTCMHVSVLVLLWFLGLLSYFITTIIYHREHHFGKLSLFFLILFVICVYLFKIYLSNFVRVISIQDFMQQDTIACLKTVKLSKDKACMDIIFFLLFPSANTKEQWINV